jgi:GNAT superfamily N-acetyltransferase
MIRVEIDDRSAQAILFTDKEVGNFTITFGTTTSLRIFIEDEFQGLGYARQLIRTLCRRLKNHMRYPESKRLYIDTDASGGFWDYLGLQPNPLYDFTESQRDVEGAGYEKYIEFSQLSLF